MKTPLLFLLSVLLFSSCSNYLVNKEELRHVPYGSSKVITEVGYEADELLSLIAKNMARSGWAIKMNKDVMQIISEPKSVEGGTSMKTIVFVEPTNTGAVAVFSGEWGLDSQGQIAMNAFSGYGGISGTQKIVWEGSTSTKPGIAFQHLMMMAFDVPDSKIFYER